jgi:hypothetical protein
VAIGAGSGTLFGTDALLENCQSLLENVSDLVGELFQRNGKRIEILSINIRPLARFRKVGQHAFPAARHTYIVAGFPTDHKLSKKRMIWPDADA